MGIVLAGEEHPGSLLVDTAVQAEKLGFGALFISDHFHPWNRQQGHASQLWPLLGAVAARTKEISLYSAVTCAGSRLHITTLAQAAATVQELSRGRFFLGLGTGERLNEGITGEPWPPFEERSARLREAVHCLRKLWSGELVSFVGEHHRIEKARLYGNRGPFLIFLAASGPKSTQLAAELADGLITLAGDPSVSHRYHARCLELGKSPGPRVTQVTVCWHQQESEARKMAHRLWPVVALPGTLFTSLSQPEEFEEATRSIGEEEVAASIICGNSSEVYRELFENCLQAGYDGVMFQQIGPDQIGFMRFLRETLAEYFPFRP